MAKPSSPAAALRARLGVAFAVLLLASSSPAGVSPTDGGRVAAAAGADPDRDGGACDPARGGGGYVDYLYIFYGVLGGDRRPALGYAAMAAWLAVLFYLLADTAAVYFCSSLEGLARLLRLPPAIAGATLLSLGNGAPDALSALASFAAAGARCGDAATAAVGLNGVLGGAMFVSSAVLGVIGLRLGHQGVAVHRAGFFRDAAFLLLALAAVAVVLAAGEVNVWGAAAFAALYVVYVLAVAFTPDAWKTTRPAHAEAEAKAEESGSRTSELHDVAETKFYYTGDQLEARDPLLPVADTAPLLQYYTTNTKTKSVFWAAVRVLELPLRLPRRLTIPDASKERWSKPAGVTSATLAPIFLSLLWSHGARGNPYLAALIASPAGAALGLLAFITTDASAPPNRFLAGWYAGGFAMSVAWAYVIANEVLSLLAAAGAVLSVDPAALGVTVLAWGNSLGDLVSNVAVAARGGPGGAQVAVSGCYGGPVFNLLVGLGLSMVLACWAGYPRPVRIPGEPGLYRALGFVFAGLLWALVMLPRRGMRVDRTLGFGLLAIYLCFLGINISQLKSSAVTH